MFGLGVTIVVIKRKDKRSSIWFHMYIQLQIDDKRVYLLILSLFFCLLLKKRVEKSTLFSNQNSQHKPPVLFFINQVCSDEQKDSLYCIFLKKETENKNADSSIMSSKT